MKCGGRQTSENPKGVHSDAVEMVRNDAMCGWSCPVPGCGGFVSDLLIYALGWDL